MRPKFDIKNLEQALTANLVALPSYLLPNIYNSRVEKIRVSTKFSLRYPKIPMTLPSIFDMISHDSQEFPMTLNLNIYLCGIILKHTLIYSEQLLTKLWNILLN